MSFNRDHIHTFLSNHKATVTFTKVDGTKRVMKCTLKEDLLPTWEFDGLMKSGFDPKKPVNEKVLPVWDLENKGWRSFRVDSVLSLEML
jgi:hypothetical protein